MSEIEVRVLNKNAGFCIRSSDLSSPSCCILVSSFDNCSWGSFLFLPLVIVKAGENSRDLSPALSLSFC